MTTDEVAQLLRVHPKQVYRLIKRGLPRKQVGSEWRFSAEDVLRWTSRASSGGVESPAIGRGEPRASSDAASAVPSLIAANGDLAIEILLAGLAAHGKWLLGFVQADRGRALELLASRAVLAAGCHGGFPPGLGAERIARIHLVAREVGLAAPPGKKVPALKQLGPGLRPLRFASRAPSAGVRTLLDDQLRKARLDSAKIHRKAALLPSHAEVAWALARGDFDAGLISRAWAARLGLPFRMLAVEPYGLLVHAADLGDPRIVALCEVAQSDSYRRKVSAVPGYDPTGAGDIRYDDARTPAE
jgi:excisionase family DNA binding protein